MAYYGLEAVRGYRYEVVRSGKLSRAQHNELDRLMAASLRHDFPERSATQISRLVDTLAERRRNLNHGVGQGGITRKGQRYAKQRTLIALKDNEPQAYVTVADNASSKFADPVRRMHIDPEAHAKIRLYEVVGRAEIEAKLRVPTDKFIHHRWLWFGQRAISAEIRAEIVNNEFDPAAFTVMDALGLLALGLTHERQPTSSYPWEGEIGWAHTLEGWGLADTGDKPEPIPVFGEHARPVMQRHFTGDFETMAAGLQQKPDAEAAVEFVLLSAGIKNPFVL